MVLKPINKLVIIRLPNRRILAESKNAIRMIEMGKTVYDPVIYLPLQDLTVELRREPGQSQCPLKGTAAYFGFHDQQDKHEKLAWSYPEPFEFSIKIKDLIAFYADKVIIEEHPL